MADLRALINYIVDQVGDKGGSVGKTALMKLVYLADVEHCRRYGKQATELKWRFYHYGPYAVELEPVLESSETDVRRTEFRARRGGRGVPAYRYERSGPWRDIESEMKSQFGPQVKRTVDRVLERWALESLWVLIDYVYFETEPMIGAKRGDFLDLSKIHRESTTIMPTAKLALSQNVVQNLRDRLKGKGGTVKTIRKSSDPVYDDIYAAASRVMNEEEISLTTIRPGTSLLAPEQPEE